MAQSVRVVFSPDAFTAERVPLSYAQTLQRMLLRLKIRSRIKTAPKNPKVLLKVLVPNNLRGSRFATMHPNGHRFSLEFELVGPDVHKLKKALNAVGLSFSEITDTAMPRKRRIIISLEE